MRRRGIRALVWDAVAAVCLGLACAAWAAFAPLPRDRREVVLAIPGGAGAGGEHAGHRVLPRRLRLTIGVRDTLVLRNEDDAERQFGPVLLGPGQAFRLPFRNAGEFEFACSGSPEGGVTVAVVPAPGAGWARLRWRIAHLVEP